MVGWTHVPQLLNLHLTLIHLPPPRLIDLLQNRIMLLQQIRHLLRPKIQLVLLLLYLDRRRRQLIPQLVQPVLHRLPFLAVLEELGPRLAALVGLGFAPAVEVVELETDGLELVGQVFFFVVPLGEQVGVLLQRCAEVSVFGLQFFQPSSHTLSPPLVTARTGSAESEGGVLAPLELGLEPVELFGVVHEEVFET